MSREELWARIIGDLEANFGVRKDARACGNVWGRKLRWVSEMDERRIAVERWRSGKDWFGWFELVGVTWMRARREVGGGNK